MPGLICYFCQTPIEGDVFEYGGEKVHPECKSEMLFIEALKHE